MDECLKDRFARFARFGAYVPDLHTANEPLQ